MQVDSYFAIGSSHSVCEDYALHAVVNERPFGVLADGCSSSPYTDFGARYLCLAAKQAMSLSTVGSFAEEAVLPHACSMVGRGLPWECLDATTLIVYNTPGALHTLVAGDGVVVARDRRGCFLVVEHEFSHNAPAYLSYRLNQQRHETFRQGVGDVRGGLRTTTATWWSSSAFGKFDKEVLSEIKDTAVTGYFWDKRTFMQHDFDFVAIFSDGLSSFQRRTDGGALEPIPVPEVLRQLMAFKGYRGEFVKRRCQKFFRKFCAQNNWSHYDDFSMVALYGGEP